ncbi:hypothetical protein IFM89_016327, partial [Coptis chinensis]
MKYLIVGIAIMKPRIPWKFIHLIGMTFLAMKLIRLFVPCVTQNKMSTRIALTVEFAWGNTFVEFAIFSMMMCQRINITALDVEFAERVAKRIFSTVIDVVRCCYASSLKNSHRCVERAMHHNCPVCFEYLFDSMKDISVLQCGHTIHLDCLKEMEMHFKTFESGLVISLRSCRLNILFAQDQYVICLKCGKSLIK